MYGDYNPNQRPTRYEEACERGYGGPPPRKRTVYRCGGYGSYDGHCGASDCETCYPGCGDRDEEEGSEQETSKTKVVIARKARNQGHWYGEIRPGDQVSVTSGFTYLSGGGRTGYFRSYTRIKKGPAWAEDGAA